MHSKIIVLASCFLLSIAGISEGFQKKTEAFIKTHFKNVDSLKYEVLIIDKKLKNRIEEKSKSFFSDNEIIRVTIFVKDSVIGYGLIDSVRSKSSWLTFMVLTTNKNSIVSLELLKTPDPNSSRLKTKFWKKQFIGKEAGQLNRIDAISGATISSHDITCGVTRLLLFLQLS
jgi:hypothetical protein